MKRQITIYDFDDNKCKIQIESENGDKYIYTNVLFKEFPLEHEIDKIEMEVDKVFEFIPHDEFYV